MNVAGVTVKMILLRKAFVAHFTFVRPPPLGRRIVGGKADLPPQMPLQVFHGLVAVSADFRLTIIKVCYVRLHI